MITDGKQQTITVFWHLLVRFILPINPSQVMAIKINMKLCLFTQLHPARLKMGSDRPSASKIKMKKV